MGRAARSINQAGRFHVTNRGADCRPVFRSNAERLDFERLLGEAHERTSAEVLAYCLMGNHFHLVLDCAAGGLSEFMHHVTGVFARHSNERHGSDGPIFRGRFFSAQIVSDQYLANAVRYAHRNPLDLGPSVGLAEYRWSSHAAYLGQRPTPEWLRPDAVLRWFDGAKDFDAFVRYDDDGADTCLSADVNALLTAIDLIVDEFSGVIDRAPQGLARTVAVRCLDRLDPSTADQLRTCLGIITPVSERLAKQRAAARAKQHPVLDEIMNRALGLVRARQVVPGTTCASGA